MPRFRRGSRTTAGGDRWQVKLLFDQNLSPRLCEQLRDIWADLVHVRTVGLARVDDSAIWTYAQLHDFIIVSKDSDFSGRASLYGAPPKVIWLTVGNCSTADIEQRLRRHREEIQAFADEPQTALLVVPGDGSEMR